MDYKAVGLEQLATVVESSTNLHARRGRRSRAYWEDPVRFVGHVALDLGFVATREESGKWECLVCETVFDLSDLRGMKAHKDSHTKDSGCWVERQALMNEETRERERLQRLCEDEIVRGVFDVNLAMAREGKHVFTFRAKWAEHKAKWGSLGVQ
ncbi:MAG: hypothetical protein HY868_16700 [Chloroflexi bacterium]|nr:hypothetical protein [Chloroflexota bacterium]